MKFDLSKENINYLKITYNDKDGFAHCVKSAIRLIGEYELLASAKFDEELSIETPQEVELGIACDNGLYKSKAVLQKVEKNSPYIMFTMLKPEEMEYQQKREYFRVKLQEDATVYYAENEQKKKLSAVTYDISANGVRIELDEKIDFPEEVKIVLYLPQKTVEALAKYVRIDDEDKKLKASFHFIDIAQSDLDYISQICFAKQLEERRKNLL